MRRGTGSTVPAARAARASPAPWLALVLALGGSAGAHAQLTPIYVVPTEDRLQAAVPDGRPLHVEFTAVDPVRLRDALGPGAEPVGPDTIRYRIDRDAPRARDADATGRWHAASFLIDHDEPAVRALRDGFLESAPAATAARAAALTGFVGRRMQATPGQGWEPASLTADALRGDCTEHAVLTTALARALGIPARVVVGLVLVRAGDRFEAYGHAWAELGDGDRWRRSDAALGPLAEDARYVPLGELTDEGPGFMLQVFETFGAWATRVVVLPAD